MPHTLTAADLTGMNGSENLWAHPLAARGTGGYTDGVKAVADKAGAYWLLDAVFSYRFLPKAAREPFQVWRLKVTNGSAVLTMTDGTAGGRPIVTQKIPFTDFPLPEITLYLEGGVLMLPAER